MSVSVTVTLCNGESTEVRFEHLQDCIETDRVRRLILLAESMFDSGIFQSNEGQNYNGSTLVAGHYIFVVSQRRSLQYSTELKKAAAKLSKAERLLKSYERLDRINSTYSYKNMMGAIVESSSGSEFEDCSATVAADPSDPGIVKDKTEGKEEFHP